MKQWDFTAPPDSPLGDHDAPPLGDNLKGRRIALLITGGIASIKAPFIARLLRKYGAEVMVYATLEALRYTTAEALEWSSNNKVVAVLTSAAEHLYKFDLYLIAPATYNSINKFALGIADNAVTALLASALGRMERGQCRILLAPTMHGAMHNSILTQSLKNLSEKGVIIIPPQQEYGKDLLPEETEILQAVCQALGNPLK